MKPPRPRPPRFWRPRFWPLALVAWPAGLWCSDHIPLLLATCCVCAVQLSLGAAALEWLSEGGASDGVGLEAAIGGQLMSSEIALAIFWKRGLRGGPGPFPIGPGPSDRCFPSGQSGSPASLP